jgi:anaerobic magnesium-protoporphyrin IX monomethyl ester cyclase
VLGEGELPFLNLLRALDNKEALSNVKGIAFREGGTITVNERERPIKDLEAIAYPYFDPLSMEYYINAKMFQMKPTDTAIAIISSRVCNYRCNFCQRLEKGIRLRPAEAVVHEIKK